MTDGETQGMVSTPYRASKGGRTTVWIRDQDKIVATVHSIRKMTTSELTITEFSNGAFDVNICHRGKLIGWIHFNNSR